MAHTVARWKLSRSQFLRKGASVLCPCEVCASSLGVSHHWVLGLKWRATRVLAALQSALEAIQVGMGFSTHSEPDDPRLEALSRNVSTMESLGASLKSFGSQYLALVLKNLRLSLRNWKGTIGLLLAPVIVVLFLVGSYLHYAKSTLTHLFLHVSRSDLLSVGRNWSFTGSHARAYHFPPSARSQCLS